MLTIANSPGSKHHGFRWRLRQSSTIINGFGYLGCKMLISTRTAIKALSSSIVTAVTINPLDAIVAQKKEKVCLYFGPLQVTGLACS